MDCNWVLTKQLTLKMTVKMFLSYNGCQKLFNFVK